MSPVLHRVTEWQRLERPLDVSSSTVLPKQAQVEQVAQGLDHLGFEYLQGWRLYSLPEIPVSVFGHPHSKMLFLFLSDINCTIPSFVLWPQYVSMCVQLWAIRHSSAQSTLNLQRLTSPMSSTKCALLAGQAEAAPGSRVTVLVHGQLAAFCLLDRPNITTRAKVSLSSLGDWLNKALFSTQSLVQLSLACNHPLT